VVHCLVLHVVHLGHMSQHKRVLVIIHVHMEVH
jgi:hypothetical protein